MYRLFFFFIRVYKNDWTDMFINERPQSGAMDPEIMSY